MDTEIEKTLELIDPLDKYKYKKMEKEIYKNNNSASSDEFEMATQIEIMLRDGLDPSLLTKEEEAVLIQVFGINKINEYKNEQTDNRCICENKRKTKRKKKGNNKFEKGRK